jgi:hypothetical protein
MHHTCILEKKIITNDQFIQKGQIGKGTECDKHVACPCRRTDCCVAEIQFSS